MITDLSQYIAAPLDVSFELDISSPRIMKCFKGLLSARSCIYPVKTGYIKKLVKALCEDGKFQPFGIEFVRRLAPKAYMRDSGVVYISYGLFFKTSAYAFVSVLCHELSHIWLSQQSFYPRLKQLNRQFKDKYYGEKDVILMSPIEVYARLVSTVMLGAVSESPISARQKKRLRNCLEAEREKLRKLESMLAVLRE